MESLKIFGRHDLATRPAAIPCIGPITRERSWKAGTGAGKLELEIKRELETRAEAEARS